MKDFIIKNKKIIIITTIIVLSSLLLVFLIAKKYYSTQIKAEEFKETLTIPQIEKLLKDYYYLNNHIATDTISYWNITEVTYVGYYNVDRNKKYYLLQGTYNCIDLSPTCIYSTNSTQNSNNDYIYRMYVTIKNGKISNTLSKINMTDSFIKVNELLDPDVDELTRRKQQLAEYFENNKLINEDNLKEWKVRDYEYVGTIGNKEYYVFNGSYTCKDNTDTCIKQNDSDSERFNVYVTYNKKNEIDSVGFKYPKKGSDNVSNSVDNGKEQAILLSNQLRVYYTIKSLIDEENTLSWDIDTLKYYGYNYQDEEEKVYQFIGTYTCIDNSSDCIKLTKKGENAEGKNIFNIYVTFKKDQVIDVSDSIDNTNIKIINKILN